MILRLLTVIFSLFSTPAQINFALPPVTINSIYQADHAWTATISAQSKTSILVTGDIMLGRTINTKAIASNDYFSPFSLTSHLLSASDITFVNLETPIHTNCPPRPTGMIFCASEKFVDAIKESGIDIVSLANNHSYNSGSKGLSETVSLLNQQGIKSTGLSKPEVIESRGVKFSFLAFNDVGGSRSPISSATLPEISTQIKQAREISDVVVVMFHWGQEYIHTPNKNQINLAHQAIDSGADIIIGAHPHWVQSTEIYKGKPIFYSLGNFIFDQYWSQETRKGLALELIYQSSQLIDVKPIPIYINLSGQPEVATSLISTEILNNASQEPN